jgi:hypothetical protein
MWITKVSSMNSWNITKNRVEIYPGETVPTLMKYGFLRLFCNRPE